jgi:flagellum-specific ATP synthase
MLLGRATGIGVGNPVIAEPTGLTAPVGPRLLGRVVDGLGRPIDHRGPIRETEARPLNPPPLSSMERRRITEPLHTGVRAIDLMTTLGRGQRIGIFSGPGVGKSTLLGTIAKSSSADVNVIALIGERGREVGDFLEHTLGAEGRARSVVIVATSDESPLLRIRAALLACTVAEQFRDAGRDVLLVMDSVTRFAHAQRQVGLSVGEPPATKGYTPSVFAMLPALLERAGAVKARGEAKAGSITGLYTILVEGDDMTEPIADAARGVLDGHIILSRKLAQRAHFPAVDVLDSISRVADDVCDSAHIAARQQIMRLMATYRDVEDLVQIGAYAAGSNPEADIAIEFRSRVLALLRQARSESSVFGAARDELLKIAMESGEALRRRIAARPGAVRR